MDNGYLNVAEAIGEEKGDVSEKIQKIIEENPNRTLYFPDGTYLLSKPIYTPADPRKSVDLRLSNYAIFKAAPDFSGGALVRLGGICKANDVATPGSNYSLTGGIIDGSGFADGVAIEGGRETKVSDVSIKGTLRGLIIERGANSGSSDSDIRDVNIVGNCSMDSVGIVVIGYDNTFTNIRIGRVNVGVIVRSGGNAFKNIHPLYNADWNRFTESVGFVDEGGANWYDYCYSDQFCTGFRLCGNAARVLDNCFCYWWTGKGGKAVGIDCRGKFNSVVKNIRIDFRPETENTMLIESEAGCGVLENPIIDPALLPDKTYEKYVQGRIIH